jgi:hypothetical protein
MVAEDKINTTTAKVGASGAGGPGTAPKDGGSGFDSQYGPWKIFK